MEVSKIVRVPEVSRPKVVGFVCDLCKAQSLNGNGAGWAKNVFDAAATTVSMTTGAHYPGGGSGEIQSVDLCPQCFEDKLLPWLQGQGAVVTTKDMDW